MLKPDPSSIDSPNAELIGAALRYVAVADWFESRPFNGRDEAAERRALATFNRVEAELRAAGGRLLHKHGHRALVLEAAGIAGARAGVSA